MKKVLFILFLSVACVGNTFAQKPVFDYNVGGNFEIGAIRVEGNEFTDAGALVSISGLKVGDKIKFPGEEIPKAIRKLWKLRLFTDIQIDIEDKIGDVLKLVITVQELPRLARYSYTGVKKAKHDDLNEAVTGHLHKGGIVTENVKVNASTAIRDYFIDKGFLDAKVEVNEVPDTILQNAIRLVFDINKGEKVKIEDILFTGNDNIKESKLRKKMENTSRKKRIFKTSKFIKKTTKQIKKQSLHIITQ